MPGDMKVTPDNSRASSRLLVLPFLLLACSEPQTAPGPESGPNDVPVADAGDAAVPSDAEPDAGDVPIDPDLSDMSAVDTLDVPPPPPDADGGDDIAVDVPEFPDPGLDIEDGGDDAGLDAVDAGLPDVDAWLDVAEDVPDTSVPPAAGPVVLSLNLHCLKTSGTEFETNAERFAAIAARVEEEDVDVLTLQEVCKQPGEDAEALLLAALADATSEVWASHWVFAHVAWEGTPDEAEEGLGVMARGELSDQVAIVHAVQGSLQRVAACATLSPGLLGLRVCSVHFDHQDSAVRLMQARELVNAALIDGDPSLDVIVAGDFNAKPGSATHAAALEWGYVDLSAELDKSRIDHVFIHAGAPWRIPKVGGAELLFTGADFPVSDHPAVLVRLVSAAASAVEVTRIKALASVGAKQYLSIRGDTAPLSWTQGWPLRKRDGSWRLVHTEWDSGTFEYKLLVDDTKWQSGENAIGTAGQDHELTPSF